MKKFVIEIVTGLFATNKGTMTDVWDEVQYFDSKDDAERELYRIEDITEGQYDCKIREVEFNVVLVSE